ncbi:MAG: hypothetical protein ACXITV_05525 [Luteibaculaceae bacterium]
MTKGTFTVFFIIGAAALLLGINQLGSIWEGFPYTVFPITYMLILSAFYLGQYSQKKFKE